MNHDDERLRADTPESFFLGGPLGRDVKTLDDAYFKSILEESRARVAKKTARLEAKAASPTRPRNTR